jgi:hypothetical protein
VFGLFVELIFLVLLVKNDEVDVLGGVYNTRRERERELEFIRTNYKFSRNFISQENKFILKASNVPIIIQGVGDTVMNHINRITSMTFLLPFLFIFYGRD